MEESDGSEMNIKLEEAINKLDGLRHEVCSNRYVPSLDIIIRHASNHAKLIRSLTAVNKLAHEQHIELLKFEAGVKDLRAQLFARETELKISRERPDLAQHNKDLRARAADSASLRAAIAAGALWLLLCGAMAWDKTRDRRDPSCEWLQARYDQVEGKGRVTGNNKILQKQLLRSGDISQRAKASPGGTGRTGP